MSTKICRVYGWKLKPKIQIEDEFSYIMNSLMRQHVNSLFDLQINYSETWYGNVISLYKKIKYVNWRKTSPSETLIFLGTIFHIINYVYFARFFLKYMIDTISKMNKTWLFTNFTNKAWHVCNAMMKTQASRES